ncbi:MAG: TraR/DksA family transcriptional regulator [Actinobacteria bacterium]|nr:TraR/DksA family transcriptional regulator [Actinomycetota bacterium]
MAVKKSTKKAAKAKAKAAPAKATAKSGKSRAAKAASKKAQPGKAKKGAVAAKAPAKKAAAKSPAKATVSRATGTAAKKRAAPQGSAKRSAAPVKEAPARLTSAGLDKAFLDELRQLLAEERGEYLAQAEEYEAEADMLAKELETGDVSFDEEAGEGGAATVDRERDLVLSAQARQTVEKIDEAIARIDAGTYGLCTQCYQKIPRMRLKAIPYADLCVDCKAGGLLRRR